MKKLIAMLLALVMVFGLVACGGSEKPAAHPNPLPPKPPLLPPLLLSPLSSPLP